MDYIRNPKQIGTNLFDCIPQVGKCSIGCNQCFFNRDGFFVDVSKEPHFPPIEIIGEGGIVRVNSGNDSNNQREYVIESTKTYKHKFYNTSIPKFDFNAPVVFTANRKEEEPATFVLIPPDNLMFVRLRVSPTNLELIDYAVEMWNKVDVPVVLTFMRYYDAKPQFDYEWKQHILNSYWCPTSEFINRVMNRYKNNRLVSMCGSKESLYCKDCLNCETYYWQTLKRMRNE